MKRHSDWTGQRHMKRAGLLLVAAVLVAGMVGCALTTYEVEFSSTAGGSVTIPGEGVFEYHHCEEVIMVATPDEGYRFVNWTGDVQAVVDVNAASTMITSVYDNYSIRANFEPLPPAELSLTVSSTAGGSVTVPGEGVFNYEEGTAVSLVATPDSGYYFTGWTGDVGTIAAVALPSTSIVMEDSYSITANFEQLPDGQFALTVSSTAGGSVTVPGEGVFLYDAGTEVSLAASPDSDYYFTGWTGNVGTVDNTKSPLTTIVMENSYSIRANFMRTPAGKFALTTSSTAGGSVTMPGEGVFLYDSGTVVGLVAIAQTGYYFTGWTGNVGTVADVNSPSTTITMQGSYSITANFAEIPDGQFALTVSSTAGGSVVVPGVGVFLYDAGTLVSLVASPDDGYYFAGWSGDVDTVDNVNSPSTTITMQASYSITANFEQIPDGQFALTASSTAGGSVTVPGEGVFLYDAGTEVGLVATAASGYYFTGWSGDVGTVDNVNSPSTTITMQASYSITANFEQIPAGQFALTVSSTAGGSVAVPGEGVFLYDAGTEVSLVANTDSGYYFTGWTGNVGTVDNVNAPSTTIVMENSYSITANFQEIPAGQFSLTTWSTAGGSVVVPGEGVFTYDSGTEVSLVATADSGYHFTGWTGNVGTVADVNSPSTTIAMQASYSITANFEQTPAGKVALTTSSTAGGSVTVPGEGVFLYDAGTEVPLVATAASGYYFAGWSGDVGTVADVNSPSTTIVMDDSSSITAVFQEIPAGQFSLTISSTEGGSVTVPGEGVFLYDAGTSVSLLATADSGYRFTGWTGDVGTVADVNSRSTTITMQGDYSVVATFDERPPDPVIPPSPTVGYTVYPLNLWAVMAPWIALFTAILVGTGLLMLRRRRAQS